MFVILCSEDIMDINERLALSYYKEFSALSQEHGVFLVQHQHTGGIFVKKVLQVYNLDVYRQLREHPIQHTPHIFELFESEGELIVIEEYISGRSLETMLEEDGPLPEYTVLSYISDLCGILAELHGLQPSVIHRDIKPSNIIITPSGELVLLDFNAARQYAASKTEDTRLLGTRGYAAPEQYGFSESDARTDIYAVGALMKTLLSGSVDSTIEIHGKTGSIINRCMMMDPKDRYPSVFDLKSDILVALGEQHKRGLNERREKSWRRFLPPGFRAGKPGFMIGVGILYFFIIYMWRTITFKNSPREYLWFERSAMCISLLLIIFFSGNYLNIQERLKISRISSGFLRVLVIISVDVLLFFFFSIFTGAVEAVIG